MPPSGFGGVGAARVGAVSGPLAGVAAVACAPATSGSASAKPTMSAPMRRACCWSMVSLLLLLLGRCAGLRVVVLELRALAQRLLEGHLVALEAVAGIGLRVFLAGIRLHGVLRHFVA